MVYKMVTHFVQGGTNETLFNISKEQLTELSNAITSAMEKGAKSMTIVGLSSDRVILYFPNIAAISFSSL